MVRTWLSSLFSTENRRAARSAGPPLIAYFWDGGQPVAHTIKNISPKGFFLSTKERWLIGTLVMITLQRTSSDPGRPDSSIIIMSKVVHHGEDGVGFAFVPVESTTPRQPGAQSHAADRKTLDRFLKRLERDRN